MLLVLLVPSLGLTCQNGETRPVMADHDLPDGAPKSLRETVDYIRDAYQRKAYLALRPYMDPVDRDEWIDLLLAADNLLAANSGALKAVEKASPRTPRERLDISGTLTAYLELFSRDVKVVGEHENRDAGKATVNVEIAAPPGFGLGTLRRPAKVEFRLREGHWVYVPDTASAAETIQAFRDLTKALDRVSRSLAQSENIPPEQVFNEYKLFVLPKLNLMASALAAR